MATLTLAPNSTWFSQGGTTVTRASITEINIVDSYTPTGNETASWDASADKDGSVMCYVNGTKLTLAGNGSGKLYANADSSYVFAVSSGSDRFENVVAINGANLLDTSNATTLQSAFDRCFALAHVDVSTWNTKNVTSMDATFQGCLQLETVDLSGWDVGNVQTMRSMFMSQKNFGHMKLKSIGDVSGWGVSKVETFRAMFQLCGNLEALDLSSWDFSSAKDIQKMFMNAEGLTTIGDVSNWDVSNVENMRSLFEYCSSLKSLNVGDWVVSKVLDLTNCFHRCKSIERLDLSGWNNAACTSISGFVYGMNRLRKVTLGPNFSFNGNGSVTATVLPTPDPAYIRGADGNWYDSNKNAYTPNAIPNKTAGTYYASVAMLNGGVGAGKTYLLHQVLSRLPAYARTRKYHWSA